MSAFAGVVIFLLVLCTKLDASDLKLYRENGLLCTEDAMNPYPGDCRKYVVCVRNSDGSYSGAVSKCPKGDAFDKDARACVPADQVSCRRRVARADPSPSPTVAPPVTVDCNGKAVSCSDCNTLRICSYSSTGKFTHLRDIPCTDGNKKTYCDSEVSSCTDKIPIKCASGYQCTSDGYFPDATDCGIYHFCFEGDDGALASQLHYCEAGQVYSSSQKNCIPRRTATDCHTAKCPVNKTLVISFPGELSHYVVCIDGKPEFVYYCGDYQEFNAANGSCEVKCKQTGRIPDSKNCQNYYECTANRVGGGFTASPRECPKNTKFDKESRACVPGKCP